MPGRHSSPARLRGTILVSNASPRVRIIDSHTCGEPTRLVLEGGPDLGSGPLNERLARFREQFDHYRSAIVNEPRGSDAMHPPRQPRARFRALPKA